MKSHLNVTGVQFFRLQIRTEISHSLGLQKSTANDPTERNGSFRHVTTSNEPRHVISNNVAF